MDISLVQEFLNQLDGVESCKVIGSENEITEIHVLADGTRSPKQIARDIETAIMTKFDIRIDRKIISIVQFKGTENKVMSRIRFGGIGISTRGNGIEVEARLLYEDKEYAASQSGVNTVANKNRLVAEATLKTIEEIIGQAMIMNTYNVFTKGMDDLTVVVVVVTFKLNFYEEALVGSAVVKSDINEAISRATLDAVNRKINGMKL